MCACLLLFLLLSCCLFLLCLFHLFIYCWVWGCCFFTWQAGAFSETCVLNGDDSDAGLSLGVRQFYGDEEAGEGNEYTCKVMVFHVESHQASFALVQHRKQVGCSVVTTGLTNSNKRVPISRSRAREMALPSCRVKHGRVYTWIFIARSGL